MNIKKKITVITATILTTSIILPQSIFFKKSIANNVQTNKQEEIILSIVKISENKARVIVTPLQNVNNVNIRITIDNHEVIYKNIDKLNKDEIKTFDIDLTTTFINKKLPNTTSIKKIITNQKNIENKNIKATITYEIDNNEIKLSSKNINGNETKENDYDSCVKNRTNNSSNNQSQNNNVKDSTNSVTDSPENNEDNDVVQDEYKDFYYNLFNKYSKYDKLYLNLTDEANKLFNENNIPKNNKTFTKEDMAMLKSITITDRDITNGILEPLKYAVNIEEIKIELNNKNLKRNVDNFSFLKNNTNLKIFYYINQDPEFKEKEPLTNIDFSNNKNLKDVRIVKTNLNDLTIFKNLDLEILSLQDNDITDISSLKEMTNLKRLDLDNNKISTLNNSLDNLNNLITLYLRDNPINDISSLKNLKNLEALHIRNTDIVDISTLESLPKLHRLYIDRMKYIDFNYFSVIKNLKNINTLFVDNITLDEFEWLKNFSTREAVDATYGEDKVRIFNFENLEIPIKVNKENIKNGKILINNPLKDFDNMPLEQSGDENGENKNPNLSFIDDKIEISNVNKHSTLNEKYEIYFTDNSGNLYGDFGGQPAEITGKVTLNISVDANTEYCF